MARHFRSGRWDAYGRAVPDRTSEMNCTVAPRTDNSLPRTAPKRSTQGVVIFLVMAGCSVAWAVGIVVCAVEAVQGLF